MMFNTTEIFGILSEDRPEVDRWIGRKLNAAFSDAVLLPFQVEKRHLKNVLVCMQLMDVMGLIVKGDLRKRIVKYVPTLDEVAKHANSVDAIVKSGSSFKGFNTIGLACLEWLNDSKINMNSISHALIAGKSPLMDPIKGALIAKGVNVKRTPPKNRELGIAVIGNMDTASTKRLFSAIKSRLNAPVVIDIRDAGRTLKMGFRTPCLKLHELERESRKISVELLTRAKKI